MIVTDLIHTVILLTYGYILAYKIIYYILCASQYTHSPNMLHVLLLNTALTGSQLRSGGVKKTVENDTLCVFEITDSGGLCYREFCFITAPSSQSGTNKPDQVFVCMDKHDETHTDETGLFGLVLVFSTRPYVVPSGREFFRQQPLAVGPLRMYTCDEFAARVLDLPKLMNPQLEAVAVTAKFLQFEDILPGMIRVVGFRMQDVLLSATADGAVLGNADADDSDNKNLDDDDQQPSGAGPSDAFSDGFDLLGMLEAAADPPPKRQKQVHRRKEASKKSDDRSLDESLETALGDLLLDDPCVQTFPSAEEIQAFRSARAVCVSASTSSNLCDWRAQAVPEEASSESGDENVEDATLDSSSTGGGGSTDSNATAKLTSTEPPTLSTRSSSTFPGSLGEPARSSAPVSWSVGLWGLV